MIDNGVKVVNRSLVILIEKVPLDNCDWGIIDSKPKWKKTFGRTYRIGLSIVNSTLFQIILGRDLISFQFNKKIETIGNNKGDFS
jgi:hypothetical protein